MKMHELFEGAVKLGDKDAKHQYELGVEKDGVRSRITVDADNRAQAASIAKKAGYEVRDVNMVG